MTSSVEILEVQRIVMHLLHCGPVERVRPNLEFSIPRMGKRAEVGKSIKFFETRYASMPVSALYMAGFVAAMPKFNEYMSTKVNVPAQNANPWTRVQVADSVMTQMASVAHEFSTAVGLAMRDTSK